MEQNRIPKHMDGMDMDETDDRWNTNDTGDVEDGCRMEEIEEQGIVGKNDGLIDMSELLRITQNTAMSTSNLSEQMGLVMRRTNENTQRIVALESWRDRHELTEVVSHVEYDNIYNAVHRRARFLLKLKYDENGVILDECRPIRKKYYGRLVSRIWNDSKKYSRVARSYRDTLKRDYDEVMTYLGAYVPKGGMQAFMEDVDKSSDA